MPAWSIYALFLIGASAGAIYTRRERRVRLLGLACMALVFVAMTLLQTHELGDDIEAYREWAQAAGGLTSWGEALALHRDVGFTALLAAIVKLADSTAAASVALPLLGAALAGVATYSTTRNWALALTLLLTNRLFLDSVFNYVRSTIASLLLLLGVARFTLLGGRWWLLLFVPAFLIHQKATVLVAALAFAARFLTPRTTRVLLVFSVLALALRTQFELRVLPGVVAQLEIFREVSRYELYESSTALLPLSLAAQVLIYVAAPLLVATAPKSELSERGGYFAALATLCLAVYSALGPEIPLLVRTMPVAALIAASLAASIFDRRMFLVRCALIAANLVGLVGIISRGELATY